MGRRDRARKILKAYVNLTRSLNSLKKILRKHARVRHLGSRFTSGFGRTRTLHSHGPRVRRRGGAVLDRYTTATGGAKRLHVRRPSELPARSPAVVSTVSVRVHHHRTSHETDRRSGDRDRGRPGRTRRVAEKSRRNETKPNGPGGRQAPRTWPRIATNGEQRVPDGPAGPRAPATRGRERPPPRNAYPPPATAGARRGPRVHWPIDGHDASRGSSGTKKDDSGGPGRHEGGACDGDTRARARRPLPAAPIGRPAGRTSGE